MPRSPKSGTSAPAEDFTITQSLKPLTPYGDLSQRDDEPERKMTKNHFKNQGGADRPRAYLPYHPEAMRGDTPGVSVRQAPKDEVC